MGIERIPVLLWKEPTGLFTAALVEDEQNNAAFGSSAEKDSTSVCSLSLIHI